MFSADVTTTWCKLCTCLWLLLLPAEASRRSEMSNSRLVPHSCYTQLPEPWVLENLHGGPSWDVTAPPPLGSLAILEKITSQHHDVHLKLWHETLQPMLSFNVNINILYFISNKLRHANDAKQLRMKTSITWYKNIFTFIRRNLFCLAFNSQCYGHFSTHCEMKHKFINF